MSLPLSAQPPLAWLHGQPGAHGLLRTEASDFQVDEELNFAPSGAGEHLLLQIEKIGQNTQYVARQLAERTGLKNRDISFAGRKDRHALTRQWFCLPWPIKAEVPWQDWQGEGYRILQVQRHHRKLRLGALKRNRFRIQLRELSDPAAVLARLPLVQQGVPNYFGEQRFGIDGGNLSKAYALFQGQSIADRQLRGLVLSAARSYLFNQQVSARVKAGFFQQVLAGDVLQLDGSGSVFRALDDLSLLQQRLQQGDLHPTAALCGLVSSDKAQPAAEAAQAEADWLAPHAALVQGLMDFRLKAERRAIRLVPQQLQARPNGQHLLLEFALPTGCFATSVLRELVQYTDVAANRQYGD
ncbi:tRNA pseudouridine(13) synthase TruD [Alkalimonas delamerensis]|uniref:tRNA pseudouridine synthase D n=1 Tax=Alkalimonas delamerensis TaxID=265981 RepID=A0ABT9GQV8_9GAMM|nr:tRNA pseudouridine(13) synthase TruD [Alkalimonas delamerensis]MDP4529336.1 tRNA pseudouridine(13) synthase TruD [Alkalimonas delamerensis]